VGAVLQPPSTATVSARPVIAPLAVGQARASEQSEWIEMGAALLTPRATRCRADCSGNGSA
jgi:hypothetical protein